uniref:uncharacterized protein LOC120339590 n=1 Tax=Styela clava TaxID=7725 RepID=UPI0019394D74|nr:uncharacterized protein LOC120339590 [Styela clava]
MSGSGLNPVQTWLWSELDDLGIDGVIYSRHILDLLISSKHSVDYLLDKKEQDIFSKITPSTKKRKHKYSRRSSSFSACEEILWKKEIAVACLLSAADTKTNTEDTASTIQQVVDELYGKLAGLHLTSDIVQPRSEGDCPLTDYNGNNVDTVDRQIVAKSKKKENYEDAFPSLDGCSGSPVNNEFSETIWNKSTAAKRMEPRSGHNSDNASKIKSSPQPDNKKVIQSSQNRTTTKKKTRFPSSKPRFSGSRSDDENPVMSNVKRSLYYPIYPRNSFRQNRVSKKSRPISSNSSEPRTQTGGVQTTRRPLRPKYNQNTRFQSKRKLDFKKKSGEKTIAQKRKFPASGDSVRTSRENPFLKNCSSEQDFGYGSEEIQLDYAHLPSWMETSLIDVSNPYIWNSYQFGVAEEQQEILPDDNDSENPKEMPFSSRWYRDSQTGLLTFHPLKTSKDESTSSGSASQRTSSLSEEDDCNDLMEEVDLDSGGETAPESWMWCPSPSLWEDGQDSPVSRLQSVYKRELLSLGAESHVSDISGRIWEEYKTIFLDLQEMDSGSDHETSQSSAEESGDDQPPIITNVWAVSEEDFSYQKCAEFAPRVENIRPSVFDTPQKDEGSFDIWTEALPSNFGGASEKLNYSNSCTNFRSLSSPTRELKVGIGSRSDSNLWGYSQMSAHPTWSVEDDLPREKVIPCDNELTKLLENGKFGYFCQGLNKDCECDCWKDASKDLWSISPKPQMQHTVWGGGDMPALQKPDTPQDHNYDDRMMHNLVDALFSDLSFDLLFGPRDDEPLYSEFEQRIPGFTPGFDPNFQRWSFDFRSLFVETPIENFQSPDNSPWQPRWNIDDLFFKAGFSQMPTRLDDIFESIASSEECQDLNPWSTEHDSADNDLANKKTTFLDSVTENEAWKTSLRIGNIWQSIAGIRPVNVIYSEHKPGPSSDEKLIPSSATHFRPISAVTVENDVDETPNYDSDMNMDTTMASEEPVYYDTGQQQYDPITETGNPGTDALPTIPMIEEPSFQVNFSKLGHDKSMQTAFEISVQQDISTTCQDLLARPPKANSR